MFVGTGVRFHQNRGCQLLVNIAQSYNPIKRKSLSCPELRLHFLQLSSRPCQIFQMGSKSEWDNVQWFFQCLLKSDQTDAYLNSNFICNTAQFKFVKYKYSDILSLILIFISPSSASSRYPFIMLCLCIPLS